MSISIPDPEFNGLEHIAHNNPALRVHCEKPCLCRIGAVLQLLIEVYGINMAVRFQHRRGIDYRPILQLNIRLEIVAVLPGIFQIESPVLPALLKLRRRIQPETEGILVILMVGGPLPLYRAFLHLTRCSSCGNRRAKSQQRISQRRRCQHTRCTSHHSCHQMGLFPQASIVFHVILPRAPEP